MEGWFDSYTECTDAHMSMTQDGPNKKFRWKLYMLAPSPKVKKKFEFDRWPYCDFVILYMNVRLYLH